MGMSLSTGQWFNKSSDGLRMPSTNCHLLLAMGSLISSPLVPKSSAAVKSRLSPTQ